MRNIITAAVKTVVAFIVSWLAVRGIEIDSAALELVLGGAAIGVFNLVVNWLGTRFPWVNQIVSLGLTKETVAYEGKHLAA